MQRPTLHAPTSPSPPPPLLASLSCPCPSTAKPRCSPLSLSFHSPVWGPSSSPTPLSHPCFALQLLATGSPWTHVLPSHWHMSSRLQLHSASPPPTDEFMPVPSFVPVLCLCLCLCFCAWQGEVPPLPFYALPCVCRFSVWYATDMTVEKHDSMVRRQSLCHWNRATEGSSSACLYSAYLCNQLLLHFDLETVLYSSLVGASLKYIPAPFRCITLHCRRGSHLPRKTGQVSRQEAGGYCPCHSTRSNPLSCP